MGSGPPAPSGLTPRSERTVVAAPALRRSVRHPWRLVFVAAALSVVAPVWVGRYLPLLDYPDHTAMVFVWFHLDDSQWGFAPYYVPHLVFLPYWLHYISVYALSFVFGPELAAKVFLSLLLLALPAGVALLARTLGRDPRLALFAFPLGWNYNLANGFLAYCSGVAMLFFALAALVRHAEEPSLRRGALATLAGVALYLFHILPWGYFLLAGPLLALLSARPLRLRRAALALGPLLPAAAVGAVAYHLSSRMAVSVNPSRGGLRAIRGVHNTPWQTIRDIPTWTLNLVADRHDEIAGALLLLCWALLFVSAPRGRGAPAAEGRSSRGRIGAALAVALGLLFLLPRSLLSPFYWWGVSMRFAVVVMLLLALTPRGAITGARRLFLGLAALVAVLYPLDVAAHFHRVNRRLRDFDAVLEPLPRGRRTLPLMYALRDPELVVNHFNQWGSYVQLQKGGYVPYNLASGFPIRDRRRLPAPPWDQAHRFRWETHGEHWDYFLVLDEERGRPFRGVEHRVRLVKRAGRWSLWERLPPGDGGPRR